ncbi:nucleotidyltransferase [bacterium]|nr:nucleotidyltransferase [bacterium]
MKPTLLVMAAGIGSRYGGLKQLDGFGPSGEKIIDYTIYDAIRSGFGKVVFVIRREMEESFLRTIVNRWRRIPTVLVFQELDVLPAGFTAPEGRKKPWGTAHAVLTAAPAVREPFAAVNADDFYGRDALEKVCGFLSESSGNGAYCVVGYRLKNTVSDYGSVARGVCEQDGKGFLTRITERTKIFKSGDEISFQEGSHTVGILGESLVSMNLWGFVPSFFDHLNDAFRAFLEKNRNNPEAEFFLPTVVDSLIQARKARVSVLSTDSKWFGITYQEDRPEVEKGIRRLVSGGVYPQRLWQAE